MKSSFSTYPFGSPMPARSFSASSYKYGFNGKEKDDEVKGEGNSVDFGARMEDARLGKFLSIDKMAKHYPCYSPYSFTANNPIIYVEVDGQYFDWSKVSPEQRVKIEGAMLSLAKSSTLYGQIYKQLSESAKPYVMAVGVTTQAPDGHQVEGQFMPDKLTGGGEIRYREPDRAENAAVNIEETFHAYQNDVKNEVYDDKKTHNLEYEAKVLVTLVQIEGSLIASPSPGAEGMFDYLYLNDDYVDNPGMIPTETQINGEKFQGKYMKEGDNFSEANKNNYPTYSVKNQEGPKAIERIYKDKPKATEKKDSK